MKKIVSLNKELKVSMEVNSNKIQAEIIKLALIRQIMDMHDTAKLERVGKAIERIETEENILNILVKPMRKKLDIEQLKKEQNYKPVNKTEFFKKLEKLEIEESIEELLAMI